MFAGNISFDIVIEQAGVSYLLQNWYTEIPEATRNGIADIFVDGGYGDSFDEAYTETFELGATDKNGNVELKGKEAENPYVNQVTGYLCDNGETLYIHSPSLIYTPVNSDGLFSGEYGKFFNVSNIEIYNLNTTNTTNMTSMFSMCEALEYVMFECDFDTLNVTSFSSMFESCTALILVNFEEQGIFDTKRVIYMSYMFVGCESLEYLNIGSFYIREDCYVGGMFDDANLGSQNGTLITPYYVGTEIYIQSLGLQETIIPVDKSGDASDEIG